MRLTKYFEDPADPSKLSLTGAFDNAGRTAWYDEHGVELHVGVRATAIDPERRVVTATKLARPGVLASMPAAASADGAAAAADGAAEEVPYDFAVLATGSTAFVPPIDGKEVEVKVSASDAKAKRIKASRAQMKKSVVTQFG